jgi:pyridoxal phosphate-dependent aminotransferase EpsN
MHLQPVFKGNTYFPHEEDVSADLFERGVCLPSGSEMTSSDQLMITEIIREIGRSNFTLRKLPLGDYK